MAWRGLTMPSIYVKAAARRWPGLLPRTLALDTNTGVQWQRQLGCTGMDGRHSRGQYSRPSRARQRTQTAGSRSVVNEYSRTGLSRFGCRRLISLSRLRSSALSRRHSSRRSRQRSSGSLGRRLGVPPGSSSMWSRSGSSSSCSLSGGSRILGLRSSGLSRSRGGVSVFGGFPGVPGSASARSPDSWPTGTGVTGLPSSVLRRTRAGVTASGSSPWSRLRPSSLNAATPAYLMLRFGEAWTR